VREVARFIERDSFRYAAALVREVRDAAASLARFAQRGRVVPEFQRTEIRELLIGSYRLIYRTEGGTTQILAFVHGARDISPLSLLEREKSQ